MERKEPLEKASQKGEEGGSLRLTRFSERLPLSNSTKVHEHKAKDWD